ARFVIARSQNAASLARAAHADGFAPQRRPVPDLDRCVKAVHIEVDDRACSLFILHVEISHTGSRRPSDVFSRDLKFLALQSRFSFDINHRNFLLKWILLLPVTPITNRTGMMPLMSITSSDGGENTFSRPTTK